MAKTVRLDDHGYRKFGMRDNLAYAAGDLGCNMSFALKSSIMPLFWNQFMGLGEELYALLFLICQIWDAINDPLIGSMIDADRRQYKLGKFRAYIFAGSIGLIIAGALCFVPLPGLPTAAKCVLFVAGYVLWDAFYTVANVPYGSLLSLISEDAGDRASLSSFRSVGSMVGNILPMAILPFIVYDAEGNLVGPNVFIAALVMGGIGFIFFQIMIRNTVQRVQTDVKLNEEAPKFNVIKAMGNFCKNRPAVGATLAVCGMFLGMNSASVANAVLFQSYFKAAQYSGVIMVFTMLPMFLFMPFIRKIVGKWGKKEASVVGALISLVGCLAMVIVPMPANFTGVIIYILCQLINGLGQGVYQCVSWSLMADAIDYSEWKFGAREEGTVYSLHSFFRKLAQGVGPSAVLIVMGWLGYEGAKGADQVAQVALNMRYLVPALYLFSAVIMVLGLGLVYNLDQKTLANMNAELEARRAEKK